MPDNQKNTQYLILFIIFVAVMGVISFLNSKISEEISAPGVAHTSAAPAQSPVAEEVKAVVPAATPVMLTDAALEDAPLAAKKVEASTDKQEEVEVIYQLPLKEIELPQ